jgi:quercetin dioxygenase-like cupin family protein
VIRSWDRRYPIALCFRGTTGVYQAIIEKEIIVFGKKLALGLAMTGLIVISVAGSIAWAEDEDEAKHGQPAGEPAVKLETLLKAALEGVDDVEVVVSRVTIPPHTSLPKHWHPGEEFAYVLEGEVVLWQDGKKDVVGKEGDALKIPLKQVHTAMTGDTPATVLVFRVHEEGQPERTLVD